MSWEATEVSKIWSQRGDKGEAPNPGKGVVLGAGLRPYPGVRQEGKAGQVEEGWESSEAATVSGKACWGKGRTISQDTEQLYPVEELSNKRCSKQV